MSRSNHLTGFHMVKGTSWSTGHPFGSIDWKCSSRPAACWAIKAPSEKLKMKQPSVAEPTKFNWERHKLLGAKINPETINATHWNCRSLRLLSLAHWKNLSNLVYWWKIVNTQLEPRKLVQILISEKEIPTKTESGPQNPTLGSNSCPRLASSFRIINIWEASHFSNSVAILTTSFSCNKNPIEIKLTSCIWNKKWYLQVVSCEKWMQTNSHVQPKLPNLSFLGIELQWERAWSGRPSSGDDLSWQNCHMAIQRELIVWFWCLPLHCHRQMQPALSP